MKIKKGDNVIVIAGKDRSKKGKVLEVFPQEDRVIVEGVNIVKRAQKKTGDKKGGIVEKAMKVHVSNVALMDPKTEKPTRIKIEKKDGKRKRIAKKSGAVIA